jgi:3-hydroxyacyl-CoA dehydrogenase
VASVARGMAAPLRAIDAVAPRHAVVRRRHRRRAQDLRRAHGESRIAGAAPRVFRRARGGKVDGLSDKTPQRKIQQVAVVGAGTMGGGIAMTSRTPAFP